MSELLCVDCEADGVRAGEDRWRLAVYIIDGRSVCRNHGRKMIKVIAALRLGELPERGPAGELETTGPWQPG